MAVGETESRSRRELRLLLLVLGVSIAVLLLLARWRFPTANLSTVTPSAAPIAELAARATFDEMGSTMVDVLDRLSQWLVVVPTVSRSLEMSHRQTIRPSEISAATSRTVGLRALGLRVRHDLALVYLPGVSASDTVRPATSFEVVSFDSTRELALVRVSDAPGLADLFSTALRSFSGLSYVAIVDAVPSGPTVQPVFIGRTETLIDARWSHPLIVVGPTSQLPVGSFAFSLGGRLLGLVVHIEGSAVIVPATALETIVADLLPTGTVE